MKLTNENIRKAKPGDVLRDGTVAGLHLRAFAARKSFYLYFRTKAGKERKPKLGDHPTLSLDKARSIARQWLMQVAEGKDPVAERQTEKDAPTVERMCKRYLAEVAIKRATYKEKKRVLEKYVLPNLGRTKVSDLTYDHIHALHRRVGAKAPVQANRMLSELSKMLNLAERWKWRPNHSNPCRHVERFPERKRRRYMRGDEAVAVAAQLRAHEATRPQSVAFIYLLILTGARKGEIAKARWDWLHGNKLVFPEHKTAHHGHDRVVYLPPQVMDLLKRLERDSDTITGIKSPQKLWVKIRKAAGCPDLRLHDLRHSFAAAAVSAGLTLQQIGELLGHTSPQTTARYAHLIDETAHVAATMTADLIEQRLIGSPTEKETTK